MARLASCRSCPPTGKELKVGDITQVEPNIHAGVKYMRFMMDQYFKDEPMDKLNKGLMTFAAYNAGPGRVRQLRREAEKRGLNPNVWFGNVERVASERIGRETVTYVSNIYKYYVAYRLSMKQIEQQAAAKEQVKQRQVAAGLTACCERPVASRQSMLGRSSADFRAFPGLSGARLARRLP